MVGEQSLWTQFVFFVGWLVVMLGVLVATGFTIYAVGYAIVHLAQRLFPPASPDDLIQPPWAPSGSQRPPATTATVQPSPGPFQKEARSNALLSADLDL